MLFCAGDKNVISHTADVRSSLRDWDQIALMADFSETQIMRVAGFPLIDVLRA
jgi:hypothetical protein